MFLTTVRKRLIWVHHVIDRKGFMPKDTRVRNYYCLFDNFIMVRIYDGYAGNRCEFQTMEDYIHAHETYVHDF